ncbi:MAG: hypothetical protein VX938_01585, partial [Myxococcota bacterium]|nr:hypothetical protein [Myxococcota bacterium]
MRRWVMLTALAALSSGCATTATGGRVDAPPTSEETMSDEETAPIWTDASTIARMCDQGLERATQLWSVDIGQLGCEAERQARLGDEAQPAVADGSRIGA